MFLLMAGEQKLRGRRRTPRGASRARANAPPCRARRLIRAIRVRHPVQGKAPRKLHARQRTRRLRGRQQVVEIDGIWRVVSLRRPRRYRHDQLLTAQSRTRSPVAETAHKHVLHPLLQQCRPAVPPQRILQYDHARRSKLLLLRLNVERVLRIEVIEMIDLGARKQDRKFLQDRLIRNRIIAGARVSRHNQKVGHRISFRRCEESTPARGPVNRAWTSISRGVKPRPRTQNNAVLQ